ncbi:MAG: signal peptidase I [Ruminococcus sp.]|nr:signal peptidase I [Ruminococcus sp.]
MEGKSKLSERVDNALDMISTAMLAVFAFVCIFTFVLRNITVVGESMEQTLSDGDKLVALRFMYTPKRGDIVVVNSENMKEVIIKRIIGVSGDRIEIDYKENAVYVNGEKLSEPYVREPMTERDSFAPTFRDEKTGRYIYTVPFDKYFILGDNRNHSTDGRIFGFVTRDEILGRVVFRYSSPSGNPRGSIE